jgi:hypothetical protein
MEGTVLAHTRRKDAKAGGQLFAERSIGLMVVLRGSGTDGGSVVERKAAK